MLKNTQTSYGLIARAIHWLTAILVLGLFGSGLYMTSLGYYDPLYHSLPWWHKSVGLTVLAVLAIRIVWMFINPKPAPLESHSRIEKLLAALVHKAIYLLLILILFSGYLISTAKGKGIEFFGWFEFPALITPFENQGDIAGEIHFVLASVLIALVVLHAAGAFKHHFIDKDNTLLRMLRG